MDDVSYSFSTNTLMLWQAGTKYQFKCNSDIDVICINFDYTTSNSEKTAYYAPILLKRSKNTVSPIIEKENFTDCTILNRPLILHNALFLEKNLSRIVAEHISKPSFYYEKSSATLKGCIVNILRYSNENPSTANKINRVIEYIQENYASELTNETLAALVDYHPYYLNRIFLKSKGVTLHQYIINYRITMAEQLLISTNTSIEDISKRVGFSSISLFTINFKKKNVLTPSQFRKSFSTI
ncbi:MAG: helix-turn-helix domain-containing protein [Acutalibacteraceae bacterium]